MIVINLWGAPSSGKSTTASGLFFLMKINKMRVELVGEFAKDLVLEGRENVFSDQNYIFAEQNRRIKRLEQHNYDFAITDSPLLLPIFYDEKRTGNHFEAFAEDEFHKDNNLNYFLVRRHVFETIGRRHNEEQSVAIERDLRNFLHSKSIYFLEIEASPRTPQIILEDIRNRMSKPIEMPFNLDDDSLK